MRSSGFLIRNCREFKSFGSLSSVYLAFVRSKLVYCSVVWNPFHVKYITALENVQKKFLKYAYFRRYGIYPVRGYSYDALLSEFDMMSLRKHRESRDMCFVYKIVHGQLDSSSLLSQILFNVPRISSRFVETFHVPVPNTMHHFHSPISNMSRSVNSVPNVDIFFLNFQQFNRTILSSIRN